MLSRVKVASLLVVVSVVGCKARGSKSGGKEVAHDLVVTSRADSAMDLGYGYDTTLGAGKIQCVVDANPPKPNVSRKPTEGSSSNPSDDQTDGAEGDSAGEGVSLGLAGDSLALSNGETTDNDLVYKNCTEQKTSDSCLLIKFIENKSQLMSSLKTSLKAGAVYKGISAKLGVEAESSSGKSNDYSFLVIKATYIKKVIALEKPVLIPEMAGSLTNDTSKQQAFTNVCGDRFVHSASYGGELLAVATINKGSKVHEAITNSNLDLKTKLLPVKGKIGLSTDNKINNEYSNLSFEFAEISGDSKVPRTFAEVLDKVKDFKSSVDKHPQLTILTFALQPYYLAFVKDESGALKPINKDQLPEQARLQNREITDPIEKMNTSIEQANNALDHYDFIYKNHMFLSTQQPIKEALGKKIGLLKAYLADGSAMMESCRTRGGKCAFPVFDPKKYELTGSDDLVNLVSSTGQYIRPGAVNCTFANKNRRAITSMWIQRTTDNFVKVKYWTDVWFNYASPLFDIPFAGEEVFFGRYAVNTLTNNDIAGFMNRALVKKNGVAGGIFGSWAIENCVATLP